jgi:serine/threonine-protein kinase
MASICALALLVAALLVTLGANRRAEAARVDAEQRFDQTRAIARTMLFDAFDEVSKVTGGTKAREILARSGLHYLDALAVDDAAPTDVRAEVVRGYTRLAQVMGSGQSGQLGKLADSNTLLGKAEAVAAPLYAAHPNDPAVIRARADLLIEQSGTNLYNNNKITLAREQAIEVQRLLERFARKEAESARIYATAIQAEADSHGWDNDYSKAREAHLRAERFVAGLPPKLGADREVLKVRSANLRLLAEAHHRLKQEGEAVQAIQRAVSINEALLRAAPDDPGQIRKLAISRWYGAVVHRTNGRNAVAREWIERAVELARSLRARDPNDAGALHLFALTGEVQAQVLADSRRFSDSFAVGADVVAAHRRLVKLSGNTAGARRSMATSLSTLGENQRAGGALGLACTSWREALAVLRGLEHAGSLSEFDRKNGLPELRKLLATHCSGGPA